MSVWFLVSVFVRVHVYECVRSLNLLTVYSTISEKQDYHSKTLEGILKHLQDSCSLTIKPSHKKTHMCVTSLRVYAHMLKFSEEENECLLSASSWEGNKEKNGEENKHCHFRFSFFL